MELPTLSVIISCRNSAATLAQTLESVVAQRYPAWWELVVVDNGSTDHTAAVARSFADRVEHFALLSVPNPGHQARGINHGIEHSKGAGLVFLDSDDVAGPDYLLHLGAALRRSPLVGARLDLDLLNPPSVRARRRPLQRDRLEVFFGYLPAVIGAAMAARRCAVDGVHGWDDALPTQHDLDLSWRLHQAGHVASFAPDAVLHYRYRTGLREICRQELGYGEGEVALYRKFRHRGLPRRTAVQVVAAYVRLLVAVTEVRRPGGPERAATLLGNTVGRLRGSLRYRTWYL